MHELLTHTLKHAEHYLSGLDQRPVAVPTDPAQVRARFDGPLPSGPSDPLTVIDELVAAAEPALVATASTPATSASSPAEACPRPWPPTG